jgi:broad specificity phosphatase PhoE
MPTYIHLVRHAQGFHNLSHANHVLPDPDLTPLGKEQCAALQRTFPHHAQITHLVASPLRRTLYTCLLSFAPALVDSAGKKRAVTALPAVQEISPLPCDTGSEVEKLRGEFGEEEVDLSLVREGWNDKTGEGSPYAPVMERLEKRAREARVWLRGLGGEVEGGADAHVVVVTHGGFLHFLTGDWYVIFFILFFAFLFFVLGAVRRAGLFYRSGWG